MQEHQQQETDRKGHSERMYRSFEERRARKKFGFGVIIIIVGLLVLLKQLGFNDFLPIREFWPFILITIGIIIGLRNKFQSPAPFILIIIGVVHVIPAFSFQLGENIVYSQRLIAPAILIGAGLYFLLVSRKKKGLSCDRSSISTFNQNFISKEVIFGGSKEIVTSKEFVGADISAIFGGVDINLTQADSQLDTITIGVRAIFGGIEIIVPPNWDVKNEVFVALGSVEDQRTIRVLDAGTQKKTLILKGLCSFGGVEIKSY